MRALVLVLPPLPDPQRRLMPTSKTDTCEPAGGRFGAIKTLDCCMCMYVTMKYRRIQADVMADTYRCEAGYIQMCRWIHTDTYRYALYSKVHMCMYPEQKFICVCIRERNTVTYIQICIA